MGDFASWIWDSSNFQPLPSFTWIEVIHETMSIEEAGTWMYYTPGSGIWFNTGKTQHYYDHPNAVKDILHKDCYDNQCIDSFTELAQTCRDIGLDSIQFVHHADE